jgi:tetratricopeptide (TPR) repeat protein
MALNFTKPHGARPRERSFMTDVKRLAPLLALTFVATLACAARVGAQTDAATTYHQIEVRLQYRSGRVPNVRVRLLRSPDLHPVAETFSRPEGQFVFTQVVEGDYVVETIETDKFESATASVAVRPLIRGRSFTFNVLIEVSLKPPPERVAPGVVAADVDLDVPKAARKRYQAGMKALDDGDGARAVNELRAAVEAYPQYFAARLELGRELRRQKQFQAALEALQPLAQFASRHAEAHIEIGVVLLSLGQRDEAARALETALRLHEADWAAHLYMGWALLETDADKAAAHLGRALELDERAAARAHLALARLAEESGRRQNAIEHLEAYLALAPAANDATAARKLIERLRTPQ